MKAWIVRHKAKIGAGIAALGGYLAGSTDFAALVDALAALVK